MGENSEKPSNPAPFNHPFQDVNDALAILTDALITWERNTGQKSVLVLRDDRGWAFRAQDGKPGVPDFVEDMDLLKLVGGQAKHVAAADDADLPGLDDMEFKDAARFKLPFGKYKGRTLDDAATDDRGLSYLVWLHNEREQEGKQEDIDCALRGYLNDPAIASEVAKLRR